MTTGLAEFFKFNLWANLRLLDTCASLVDSQLDATTRGTFGSVRQTLIHIFGGEEGYVELFTGTFPTPRLEEQLPFPGFDELRRRAKMSGEALITIAERWEPGQALQLSDDEQSYEVPVLLILIQAVNHATDHRSQIATLLSQQGVTPPEVDGWGYYSATR